MEQEKGLELFEEIEQYHRDALDVKTRYNRLYRVLDRAAKELTAHYAAEYTSLFARLSALCQHGKYAHTAPIKLFTFNVRKVQHGEYTPQQADYLYDLKALCEFISFFYQTPVPIRLRKLLPDGWRTFDKQERKGTIAEKIRFIVESWDASYIYGHDQEVPDETLLRVDYHQNDGHFSKLSQQIRMGSQLNLLSVKVENRAVEAADQQARIITLYPELIVLEPDFLIDISSLSRCCMNYGSSPCNYLIDKLRSSTTTRHILLGNAANQFLDDCVNESDEHKADFNDSILRNFRDFLLDYSVCEEVDKAYFCEAKEQFQHIHRTVQQRFNDATVDVDKGCALLEPSFFCEALGLQGRMDLMLHDFSSIIELKSGKAEEYSGPIRGKYEHTLQMALYKEILHYSLSQARNHVHTYLFYSRYPHLFEEPYSKTKIQQAIALRNAIVFQEQQLRDGQGLALLQNLTLDDLNQKQNNSILWRRYQAPQLSRFLETFQHISPLEACYFNHFLQFMEREQFLAKIGDEKPDSGRGFAETWNAALLTKQANGNILIDLTIRSFVQNSGIEKIWMELPIYDEGFLPNFREGDFVILYERNKEDDLATNHIVHRCCIEQITEQSLLLKLNYKQRNPIVFNRSSLYALEHDHMDSAFNTIYRGLYAFLQAPQERRDLLLLQREPQTDPSITCTPHTTNEAVNRIVLQAKQAQDYFLLVGPPGTGKTSVTLKAMVEEFYSQPTCQLLLLSYTNRAVDEICQMLGTIQPQPPYLRIGSELTCDPAYRPHLVKNQALGCKDRTDILHLFAQHRIIVGTVASISGQMDSLFRLKQFDVAIVDESSQILEPHLLGLLSATHKQQCCIQKFILIGDHKQLPAVVVQSPEHSAVQDETLRAIGLTDRRNSLFERLYNHQLTSPTTGITATLLRQGRMHPDVGAFANEHFYHGELLPVPVQHQTQPLEFTRHGTDFQAYVATTRMGFLHCDAPTHLDNNKCNNGEAQIVAALVGTVYQLCKDNHLPFNAAKRIGIIVPFRGQIAMIRRELSLLKLPETDDITIDTVERFQGSQRDIIIFSTTISQPYQLQILSVPVVIENQLVDRKLNVALTRARKQLFIVGNAPLLSRHPLYKELIEACTR